MDQKDLALLGAGKWSVHQLEEGRPADLTEEQLRRLAQVLGFPEPALRAELELAEKVLRLRPAAHLRDPEPHGRRRPPHHLEERRARQYLHHGRHVGHVLPAMKEQAVSNYTALADLGGGGVTWSGVLPGQFSAVDPIWIPWSRWERGTVLSPR